jgi:tetrahydromethanopterin S-methyltransferase subunit C
VALDLDIVARVQRRGIETGLPSDGHLAILNLSRDILRRLRRFLESLDHRGVGPRTMAAAVVGADAHVVLGAKVEVLHASRKIRTMIHYPILSS